MKKYFCVLLAGLALANSPFLLNVRAAALMTEAFDYVDAGGSALNGIGGWTAGAQATIQDGNLTYVAMPDPAVTYNKRMRLSNANGLHSRTFNGSAVGSGSVYVSFLFKLPTLPTTDNYYWPALCLDNDASINLNSGTGFRQARAGLVIYCRRVSSTTYQFGVRKNEGTATTGTTTWSGATFTSADTVLVVGKYTFGAGAGDDTVTMWINPVSLGGAEDGSPAIAATTSGNANDSAPLQYIVLVSASSGNGGGFPEFDNIRVGQSWADVTPAGPPPVGAKLGFTTQPTDTQVNAIMNPVVVQVQSVGGISAASNNVPITLTRTSGSGTLYGTTTQNTDSSGKATFNDLYIDTVGTGNELTATASGIGTGLTSAISADFDITSTPVITGMALTSPRMQPQGFVFDGQNGVPGAFCQVLATTDLNDTNWIIVSYQNFNGSGDITFTNPVSPAMPKVFYRLRTGDTTTKIQAPSIGIPPQSEIVSPGATAVFTVTATGPLLQYLWYFNGNPIAGATGSTLTINNAQAGNIGNYYVTVANPAGSISSAIATLGVGNVGPTIVNQPQSQTVFAGGTALFTVNATGTSPLSYQWYFNSSNLLSGKTTAHLTLTGVTTNDAGYYSVVVSNAFNTATSTNTLLDITPVPTGLPDTNMVGYAATFGVTGGAGGSDVFVSDYASLRAYCRQAGPLIIHIQGTITANENYCYVDAANKTIVGDGTNAEFFGDLRLSANNIIVQNLYIHSDQFSDADAITVDTSGHGTGQGVWIDHCTLYDCRDGSIDVTKGADFVTISWCKFYYAPVPPGVVNHEFVNLLGSSDNEPESAGKLHVTFHHNWYSDYCRERMPSVRYGRAHVFNNYYDCAGNNYCVRTRLDAQVLVENNYYLGVQNPWEKYIKTRSNGLLHASGNITNNCVFSSTWTSDVVLVPGTDVLSDMNPPPYTYTLDPADVVPYYVQTYAGSGKYPFAP